MSLNFTIHWLNILIQNLALFTGAHSVPSQTTKMQILTKIKTGLKPMTIFPKTPYKMNDWNLKMSLTEMAQLGLRNNHIDFLSNFKFDEYLI